jgi:SAM-dependent methyltransferase
MRTEVKDVVTRFDPYVVKRDKLSLETGQALSLSEARNMATPQTVLDINRAACERYKDGRWSTPVSPEKIDAARRGEWEEYLIESKPVPRDWFPELRGADVLALASGGGQQGPILAAAGAKVTVLDASPAQLARDRLVAERDHLDLETVQGDMTDLSRFGDERFDLVFHPVANHFVPDVRPVWCEAFRVLKPGGVLLAGFLNPMEYIFDWAKEDAGLLEVAHTLPFSSLDVYGEAWLRERGEAAEYSHSLEAQIGGQLAAGFRLTHLLESHRAPGTGPKAGRFPSYIATRAVKPPRAV